MRTRCRLQRLRFIYVCLRFIHVAVAVAVAITVAVVVAAVVITRLRLIFTPQLIKLKTTDNADCYKIQL